MKETEQMNIVEGANLPLCSRCANFLREKCVTQCQQKGDLSNFAPRKLREGELLPPFPEKLFNRELDAHERQLMVSAYLSWIVTELNRLRRRE